ncbi:MAG: SprT family zinc-dependent metalloprotease [Acidobacteriia bacterium]|nr:SprT family zinc-dependent metalloprotease [Terriglobia bacterium]MYC67746.1 SprT family zinc-dependent metalloprotease [Terriglobia bacterium]
MSRPAKRANGVEPPQLLLDVEEPESIFRRAFRRLKPRTEPPEFDVRYRRYARLKSTIRFDAATATIRADISDLVQQAPPEVVEALATILLCKLYRKRVSTAVRQRYERWVHTPETQQGMLEIRKDRGRKRVLSAAGEVYDLDPLFDQLNARHFASALHKPGLGWSPRPSRRRLGYYDAAHDVIVISRILDCKAVPQLALDYVLYHEMLHVKHPVQLRETSRCVHTSEFLADERRFPGIDRAKRILQSL